jgi:Tfp pilus assembly protein PilP
MTLAKTHMKRLTVMALSAFCGILWMPGAQGQTQTPAPPAKTATSAKPSAKKTAKAKPKTATPVAPAAKVEAPAATAPAEGKADAKDESNVARRDPFLPLVNDRKEGLGGDHLPPGKAGLVVATVRVDGTVSAPNGMIAVVSNPEARVYFIREGDRLYDGTVEKIGLDGVTFRESSKDAFGKQVEREVTKRIYASAGEQQ